MPTGQEKETPSEGDEFIRRFLLRMRPDHVKADARTTHSLKAKRYIFVAQCHRQQNSAERLPTRSATTFTSTIAVRHDTSAATHTG